MHKYSHQLNCSLWQLILIRFVHSLLKRQTPYYMQSSVVLRKTIRLDRHAQAWLWHYLVPRYLPNSPVTSDVWFVWGNNAMKTSLVPNKSIMNQTGHTEMKRQDLPCIKVDVCLEALVLLVSVTRAQEPLLKVLLGSTDLCWQKHCYSQKRHLSISLIAIDTCANRIANMILLIIW